MILFIKKKKEKELIDSSWDQVNSPHVNSCIFCGLSLVFTSFAYKYCILKRVNGPFVCTRVIRFGSCAVFVCVNVRVCALDRVFISLEIVYSKKKKKETEKRRSKNYGRLVTIRFHYRPFFYIYLIVWYRAGVRLVMLNRINDLNSSI